ncbi:hypothetical protein A2U01_0091352, partial [Trifolium medium]|nr:hypothetical protein [Trifolium medium]
AAAALHGTDITTATSPLAPPPSYRRQAWPPVVIKKSNKYKKRNKRSYWIF